jgi:hypothetical protein
MMEIIENHKGGIKIPKNGGCLIHGSNSNCPILECPITIHLS